MDSSILLYLIRAREQRFDSALRFVTAASYVPKAFRFAQKIEHRKH
jgi:hypothetical protein